MKKLIPLTLLFLINLNMLAQVDINYQKPPKEILELADIEMAPSMRIDDHGERMVLLYRNQYKSIAELAEKEMRLAGLRINPKTNISSRERYYNNIAVMKVGDKKEKYVSGLPDNPRYSNFSWSPDEKFMAFTNTTSKGVELWILDVDEGKARKLTPDNLNANMGQPYTWLKNSNELLVKQLPDKRKPLIDKEEAVPSGPRVSVNEGQEAQNRTYQDLLEDKIDEANFEQLVRAKLTLVDLEGNTKKWMKAAMYRNIDASPDGQYILITTIHRPFSYLVPYYRFPTEYNVYTKAGKHVKTIEEVPLTEEMPKGFMAVRKGKRRVDWRNDQPATLVFAEALDEGDPEKNVDYRDQVYTWKSPFEDEPQKLVKTFNRYSGMLWGTDELALVYDYWWNTRNMKAYFINPAERTKEPVIIIDRNYQDRYNDPGSPVTKKNKYGERVMQVDGDYIYLEGDGYSPEGILPFIDRFHIKSHETERLWRANANNKLERIIFALDIKKGKILTRIESKNEYPNYYIRDIRKDDRKEVITYFKNPFESLTNVQKELIKYKRND